MYRVTCFTSLLLLATCFISFTLGGQQQDAGLPKTKSTSFETAVAGEFEEAATEIGTWVAHRGNAAISRSYHRDGKQCLHLLGGTQKEVDLIIEPVNSPNYMLSFWAERWTSRNPFSFVVEAQVSDQWQPVYDGTKSVVVGRSFKSHVKFPIPAEADRLRFRCTSPEKTGLLIDDVELKPAKRQEVQSVSVPSFTLPALLRNEHVAIGKSVIQCDGSRDPASLESANVGVKTWGVNVEAIESIALATTGSEPGFHAFDQPNLLTDWTPLVAGQAKLTLAKQLDEGKNHFWVLAKLADGASIDGRIQATISQVTVGCKAIVPSKDDDSWQGLRMGVAVRNGGEDQVHTYRIPGLATTRKGTLIGVYDIRYQGGGDLPGHIDVGMSRSTDGGQTWESMKTIMDMGDDPKWRYDGVGDPSILVDDVTGTIWVAGLWSHGNRGWIGSGQGMKPEETGQFLLVRSDDDGKTWSQPINITSQVKDPQWCLLLQGPGKGITMRDGTLVFPAQFQDTPGNRRLPRSTIIYSRDRGKTWQSGTGAFDDTTEAQVVEVEPGKLMLNCRYNRSNQRVVMVTSDLGKTWQAHPSSLSALIEPGACQGSLIDVERELDSVAPKRNRQKDQKLLLFSNPNSTRGRNHLTIKASLDGGLTWPVEHQCLLDEGSSAGYSCLSMVDEETVGILYEGSQAHMTFQRIKLKDILNSNDERKVE